MQGSVNSQNSKISLEAQNFIQGMGMQLTYPDGRKIVFYGKNKLLMTG